MPYTEATQLLRYARSVHACVIGGGGFGRTAFTEGASASSSFVQEDPGSPKAARSTPPRRPGNPLPLNIKQQSAPANIHWQLPLDEPILTGRARPRPQRLRSPASLLSASATKSAASSTTNTIHVEPVGFIAKYFHRHTVTLNSRIAS
jgi:hypothetical protein